MKLDTEYKVLGSTEENLDAIIELVASRYDDNTSRQDIHRVHKDTKAVIARFNTEETKEDYPILDELKPLLSPLLKIISKELGFNNMNFHKLMIAKLPPKKFSSRHTDNEPIMSKIHRVHWCLQTNDDVEFIIGYKKVPFERGLIVDISNQGYGGHSVINNGDQDRLHLIVDCYDETSIL